MKAGYTYRYLGLPDFIIKSGYSLGLSSLGSNGHSPVFGKSTASECMWASLMHAFENIPARKKNILFYNTIPIYAIYPR